MKFRCERDVLAEAVSTVGRAVTSRASTMPVLAGVRLELQNDQLRLTGSDLDLTITHTVEVAGDTDGVAVLPAKLAGEIVRVLESGRVEVSVVDDEAVIAAGRGQFAVRAIPAAEFPRPPEPTGDGVTLSSQALADALRQVVVAASTEETRPILTGVNLAAEGDGLRLVATDSYRLVVRDLPGTSFLDAGQSVLVPSNALRELSRILGQASEVTVRLGERDAAFEVGDIHLVTRLIEGEFPNYRSLIPTSHQHQLRIGREALLDAVRRVKVVARDPSSPVKLEMSTDGLTLSASAQDVGNAFEQLDAKYEGEDLTVAFNPEFLFEGLEVSTGDEVTLSTVDAQKPALLRSVDDDDFLYLLMPVRVS